MQEKEKEKEKENITVIFSGGGIKGLIYCGVFKAYKELLYDNIVNINQIIGISIGTIFAFLWIIGFTSEEIQENLSTIQFDTFNEFNFELLFTKYGLNTGNNLINHISSMMNKKNIEKDITLLGLYNKFKIDFGIVTTNLHTCELYFISYINNPNIRILDVIRMAISIPFLFTAKRFLGDIHVDAALISNYPCDFLDKYFKNKSVFGINIISKKNDKHINGLSDFFSSVIKCLRRKSSQNNNNIVQTCNISCDLNDNLIYGNFELSTEKIEEYIDLGYTTFINTTFL